MLPVVQRGPYAEHRAATREHVQCGDDLCEQPGMAVRRTGDQQAEPHLVGLPAQVAEGRVALEHRLRRAAEVLHLNQWSMTVNNSTPPASATRAVWISRSTS